MAHSVLESESVLVDLTSTKSLTSATAPMEPCSGVATVNPLAAQEAKSSMEPNVYAILVITGMVAFVCCA